MAIGRPTKPLNLSSEEREKLAMLPRRAKSSQAVAMRARIVLGCDEGLSNDAVAKNFHVIKRHPVRTIVHDPALRSGSGAREGAVYAPRWCARGSRARADQGVRGRYARSAGGHKGEFCPIDPRSPYRTVRVDIELGFIEPDRGRG